MVNFGTLTAEIRWRVWGSPANFNRFLVLALLLHWRRSTQVSDTLQDVWLSPNVCTFLGVLPPNEILPAAKFTLRSSLAFSYIGSVITWPLTSCHQPNCGVVQGMELWNCRRGHHLYSSGWPSCVPSAHILVCLSFNGLFSRWTWVSQFSISFLLTLIPEENLLVQVAQVFMSWMFFLSSSQQYQITEGNTKHWPQPVVWPCCLFIVHCTPDGRGIASLIASCQTPVPL